MGLTISKIVGLVLAMVVIGLIFPLGLGYIAGAGSQTVTINGTTQAVSALVDPTVLTLLTVLLPIMAVVGLIMYFVPRSNV